MGKDDKQLVLEHLKLQDEFREYVKKHGFDPNEYYSPTPGSFYEKYKKRWTELTREMTPVMHSEDY